MRSFLSCAALLWLLGGCSTTTNTGGGDDECTTGQVTCPCFPNDTCDAGLSCLSGLCVEAATGGAGTGGGEPSGGRGGGFPFGGSDGGPIDVEIPDWPCTFGNEFEVRCVEDVQVSCIAGEWIADAVCAAGCEDYAGCLCEDDAVLCVDASTLGICVFGLPPSFETCGEATPICDEASSTCVCEEGKQLCDGAVASVCVGGQWSSTDCPLDCSGEVCASAVEVASAVECPLASASVCTDAKPVCQVLDPDGDGGADPYAECVAAADLAPDVVTFHSCDAASDCAGGQTCCRGADPLCPSYCSAGSCADAPCGASPDLQLCNPFEPDCPADLVCDVAPFWLDTVPLFACQ